jgi:RimJ/RimL family protein N-acetyltransferase
LVFGCDIADYNLASRKAFQKIGYQIDAEVCTQKMSEKEGEPSGKIGLTKNHKKPGGSRWSLAQNR